MVPISKGIRAKKRSIHALCTYYSDSAQKSCNDSYNHYKLYLCCSCYSKLEPYGEQQ